MSEKKYGLRYTRIVADGDSSVLATLMEKGPEWCKRHLKKVECPNHSCKCLRGSLEKLVCDKPHFKGTGRLTKKKRVHITSYCRGAIRHHAKRHRMGEKGTVKDLKKDIMASLDHVFGHHEFCSKSYCKGKLAKDNDNEEHGEEEEDDSPCDILDEQVRFWTEGMSTDEQDEVRNTSGTGSAVDSDIRKEVCFLLNRLASKADKLIYDFTTNIAEAWMSIRSKFDGGKRVNRTGGRSWHGRCYGAGLRNTSGPTWAPKTWEQCTGTPAGYHFENHYNGTISFS